MRRPARRRAPPVSRRAAKRSATFGPVDDVPPRVDVVGAAVLVVQVVGVLPDVDAEQRRLAVADRVVLVGGRDDREAGAVVDEPGPAGAEAADAGVLELRLEVVERAERGVDRVARARRRARRRRRATSTPRTASGCSGRRRCCGPAPACRRAASRGSSARPRRLVGPVGALERGVGVGHVGLVMLVVMELHRRVVDVRLERVVVVGETAELRRPSRAPCGSESLRTVAPLLSAGRATRRLRARDDPPLQLLPADRARGARRRRGDLAQADGARRADPPGRLGAVVVAAGRLARAPARSCRSCARR